VPVRTIGGIEEIAADECLRLLATQKVGRVGVVLDNQPLILPVNYALDGDTIVFRTDAGAKLVAASLERVAFEVDEIDPRGRMGWSVLVQGVGQELRRADGEAFERAQALPIVPWVGGEKQHWVRVVSRQISGRRVIRRSPT
jgi:nitroimidazol reductase NimA-like FMN-containing flavoprotein (pyridoxamine 5'-phosphate oxidase superfamily)